MDLKKIDILILRYTENRATEEEIKQLSEWVKSSPDNVELFVNKCDEFYATRGVSRKFSSSTHYAKVFQDIKKNTLSINDTTSLMAEQKQGQTQRMVVNRVFKNVCLWGVASLIVVVLVFYGFKSDVKNREGVVHIVPQNPTADTLKYRVHVEEAPHFSSISIKNNKDAIVVDSISMEEAEMSQETK